MGYFKPLRRKLGVALLALVVALLCIFEHSSKFSPYFLPLTIAIPTTLGIAWIMLKPARPVNSRSTKV